jgi:hypothetical protein
MDERKVQRMDEWVSERAMEPREWRMVDKRPQIASVRGTLTVIWSGLAEGINLRSPAARKKQRLSREMLSGSGGKWWSLLYGVVE